MNGYLVVINIFAVVFILAMLRRLYYRGLFFLHIFQLEGYKTGAYWQWLRKHWSNYVLTYEHGLLNLLVLLLFVFFRSDITRSAATVIIVVFTLFWIAPVKNYRGKQKKKFVMTPRMIRLASLYIVLCLLLPVWGTAITYRYSIVFLDIYVLAFTWIIADVILAFWIFPAAALLYPFEQSIQNNFKRLARKKIREMPDLKVIAITGSYGKTSTKFIIRDILKERFSVCATPGSYNTPMGICKVINNDLQSSHQVLVLEMGARFKGNIRELCEIAQPDISIVTNIGFAHLETFGSQKAIQSTKGEIIENAQKGGLAVLNADDPLVLEFENLRDDLEILKTGIENGVIRAGEIEYDHKGCRFTVVLPDGQQERIQTQLLGRHNIQNILLGIGVGYKFGLRLKTMALAIRNIEPVEHRLELKTQNGLMIIDDAFNSNPVGAKNALDILSRFNAGRRVIITPGMIELGEREYEENKKFGIEIGRSSLDKVILVGQNQTKPIQDGIKETGYDFNNVIVVNSLYEANDSLKGLISPGDIVLYENDLPDTYNENNLPHS